MRTPVYDHVADSTLIESVDKPIRALPLGFSDTTRSLDEKLKTNLDYFHKCADMTLTYCNSCDGEENLRIYAFPLDELVKLHTKAFGKNVSSTLPVVKKNRKIKKTTRLSDLIKKHHPHYEILACKDHYVQALKKMSSPEGWTKPGKEKMKDGIQGDYLLYAPNLASGNRVVIRYDSRNHYDIKVLNEIRRSFSMACPF